MADFEANGFVETNPYTSQHFLVEHDRYAVPEDELITYDKHDYDFVHVMHDQQSVNIPEQVTQRSDDKCISDTLNPDFLSTTSHAYPLGE